MCGGSGVGRRWGCVVVLVGERGEEREKRGEADAPTDKSEK